MKTKLTFETTSVADLIARGLAEDAKKTEAAAAAKGPAPVALKTKVLIVDDEPLIADTLAVILNQHGFAASATYSGELAMDLMHKNAADLLISDVSMGKMNGIELAITTRERWPQCKILLFSGNASTVDLLQGARNRGYDFQILTKPVHPRDLLDRLAG